MVCDTGCQLLYIPRLNLNATPTIIHNPIHYLELHLSGLPHGGTMRKSPHDAAICISSLHVSSPGRGRHPPRKASNLLEPRCRQAPKHGVAVSTTSTRLRVAV